MKNLLSFILCLFVLTASAQTASVIVYTDSLVYRIDTIIIVGDDTITSDSNFVRHNYHFINPDSIYEDQFVILDSLGKVLVPLQALIDKGLSSSGTTYRIKLTAFQITWTPKQLRDSLILPILETIYGSVIKL